MKEREMRIFLTILSCLLIISIFDLINGLAVFTLMREQKEITEKTLETVTSPLDMCELNEAQASLRKLEDECHSHNGSWVWVISNEDLVAIGRCAPFWEGNQSEELFDKIHQMEKEF